MINTPYTHIENDFKVICYFNDEDFNYNIKIGEKCAVTMDTENKNWIAGIVQDINDDGFILNTMNGTPILIQCKYIYDICGEEEPFAESIFNTCMKTPFC